MNSPYEDNEVAFDPSEYEVPVSRKGGYAFDAGSSVGGLGADGVIYADTPSAMRQATDPQPVETRAQRRRTRRERIIARRGAFKWLPVCCSNDLVHGSWWFVVGSIIATLIPIVPLVDLFYPFWTTTGGSLPLLEDAATFGLLIASGVFFTFGSYAFVRATEEPPLRPLLISWSSTHLATDELLAAWLFLFATIPFVPFMAVYVYYNSDVLLYWGCLVASIIFVIATYFFVLACYPSEEARHQIIPYLTSFICSDKCWMKKHLANDWLAGTWIFYYATLLMCIGSVVMLVISLRSSEINHLEVFDWASSTLDSIIFLIGSAYFCAGSYSQEVVAEKPQKVEGFGPTHEYDPLLPARLHSKDRGV